jgi:leucyl aminopeptidase
MIDLPEFSPLRISQIAGKAGRKQFDVLDHVVVLVPERPGAGVFRALPQGNALKRLFERARKSESTRATGFLDNKRATAVTVASFRPASTFQALVWARQLVSECTARGSAKVGLLALELTDPAREQALLALTAAAEAAAFSLPSFKSSKGRASGLSSLRILSAEPRLDLAPTRAEARGNNIARWFTALPPNVLTAGAYRDAAKALAAAHGLGFEFLSEAKLEKLGAGAFLAVSQGNAARDAGIVHLRYRPGSASEAPALALVGKGILFDTGGNNLKPFKHMLDMHTDMQGSAVALGTAVALATRKVDFPFDVWLAVSENRVSGTAYKSQDVVVAANGTSIQVIHTDAEGRMVLADTLTLAARTKPKLIIDYATLTGACVAALTTRYSGVFSNRPQAQARLVEAGIASGERVWAFPMDDDFEEPLKSDIADVKQCAVDGSGDHILAARFLQRFVPDSVAWVHMDLSSGQNKGGLGHVATEITGFGVRYTLELLLAGAEGPAGLAASWAP